MTRTEQTEPTVIRFPLENLASHDVAEHRVIISARKLDFRCHSGMVAEDDTRDDTGILFVRGNSRARREIYTWYGDGEYTTDVTGFRATTWEIVRAALDRLPDDPVDRRSEYLRLRRAISESSDDKSLLKSLLPQRLVCDPDGSLLLPSGTRVRVDSQGLVGPASDYPPAVIAEFGAIETVVLPDGTEIS